MNDLTSSAESRGRCGRCGRHEPHSHPELWGKEKMPPGGEDFKVERATTSAATPKWATLRWRILYRLFRAMPVDEGERLAVRLHLWETDISDALDLTVIDHGVHRADLDRCVAEIKRLRRRAADLEKRHGPAPRIEVM